MAAFPALAIGGVDARYFGQGQDDKIRNSLRNIQLSEAQRTIDSREAMKAPLASLATGNRTQQRDAIAKIAQIDPETAIKIRSQMPQNDLDQLKAWAGLFGNVQDPQTYFAAVKAGQAAGLDTSNLPIKYDANFINATKQIAGAEYTLGPGQVRFKGGVEIGRGPEQYHAPQTVIGPDGKPYYLDGKPVLPNVQSPRDEFMKMIGGDSSGLGGGAGNDQLQSIPIEGVPSGASMSGGTDTAKPTVKELFRALPQEVQAGILAAKDPMQAFSSYMTRQKGLDIQFGPDGKVTSITQGGGGTPGGMQKATAGNLEKDLLTAREGIARLARIQMSVKPEYMTYPTQMENMWRAFKEKAGVDLSPGERQQLADYTAFRRDAFDNINRYIKEITGAQMSAQEADRITKGMPDPQRDSPTEFASKMQATMGSLRMSAARYVYALRSGLDPKSVNLDTMPSIVNERGKQIEQTVSSRNPEWKPDQVQQFVKKQLMVEFGLE